MGKILFVTWDGGGNRVPTSAIARELGRRGHDVRVLGHDSQAGDYQGIRVTFVPYPSLPGFRLDASGTGLYRLFTNRRMAEDTIALLTIQPADAVVVDCMLISVQDALDKRGIPFAILEHSLHDVMVKAFRTLGLVLWPRYGVGRLRADARPIVAASIPSLLPFTAAAVPNDPRPGEVVFTGAMIPAVAAAPPSPTVVVSLSTYRFPALVATWQQVLDAVDGLPARVVATLGPAIAPGELRVPASVELHDWMPHEELLRDASLVVGHGGHGTTLAALAHGVPLLILPLDGMSDQPKVGAEIQRAGLGRRLPRRSSASEIRGAIDRLLVDEGVHDAAQRLGASIRTMNGPARGAHAVEAVARPVG
ncbi:glycosyltransferase [Microbacterium sp. ASV49]|uniref:Glycosyltransferase n=1 Tax=Microbacterium candidum TaxID=3041922 RepID=A0ABT7MYS4_9MICO|nr:glycosyltransferase [Microbacterium sp. ASV49]MDL9979603.1 glycosyltransferase [Microbacterium sp. ASV49]